MERTKLILLVLCSLLCPAVHAQRTETVYIVSDSIPEAASDIGYAMIGSALLTKYSLLANVTSKSIEFEHSLDNVNYKPGVIPPRQQRQYDSGSTWVRLSTDGKKKVYNIAKGSKYVIVYNQKARLLEVQRVKEK